MTLAAHEVRPLRLKKETLLRLTLWLMLSMSCVSFIEPSPYEMFFFLLIPVALLSGLSITRTTFLLALIVTVAMGAEVLAVMPHLASRPMDDGMTPSVYTVYSVYLWYSGLLFALIFSRHTEARLSIALKAYGLSCVFAGVWGILSYLNIAGIGDHEPVTGRIAGPFKDPNVLGSYSVLGATFFVQAILVSRRYRLLSLIGLVITLFGGVFLSFSRGAWGATTVSCTLMVIATYVTADNYMMRRRIIASLAILAVVIVAAVTAIFANDGLRSTITDRAKLEQEYDGGVTGRFGNQKRSIPMLMERPLGFGAHRFTAYFDLDPHNSYIGAFSSMGWIGGCMFFVFVGLTGFMALRLTFIASPYRRYAQVVGPALVCLFLQAIQIDIDHWRFVYLMVGMIWGMESARRHIMYSTGVASRLNRVPAPIQL